MSRWRLSARPAHRRRTHRAPTVVVLCHGCSGRHDTVAAHPLAAAARAGGAPLAPPLGAARRVRLGGHGDRFRRHHVGDRYALSACHPLTPEGAVATTAAAATVPAAAATAANI